MGLSRSRSALALPHFILGPPLLTDDTPEALFDFPGADPVTGWQTSSDGVMGGVSEGQFKITDKKTLENHYGFAPVRSRAKKFGLQRGDPPVARVRGDGRGYSMNL
jgi:hypothetical protein